MGGEAMFQELKAWLQIFQNYFSDRWMERKNSISRQTAKHYKDEILKAAREKTDYLQKTIRLEQCWFVVGCSPRTEGPAKLQGNLL